MPYQNEYGDSSDGSEYTDIDNQDNIFVSNKKSQFIGKS